MALTLDDLYNSPDHYLHSFEGDAAVFVPMDRAAYHRSIFLDDRISPADEGSMAVPLATFASVPLALRQGTNKHNARAGAGAAAGGAGRGRAGRPAGGGAGGPGSGGRPEL